MSPKLLRLFVLTLASISLAICAVQTIQAQGSEPSQPLSDQQLEQRFSGAANRWQLTAIDFQSQRDTVAPSIRATRNAYRQSELQHFRDIEKAHGSWAMSGNMPRSQTVEFFTDPNEIWVIATFDHFLVVPIDPDFQLLYTEINFRIDQVIHQPRTSSLTHGMSFDIIFNGGRIKKPNGEIVSWLLSPSRHSFQPGHTYLLQIIGPSCVNGVCYTGDRWDVSTGIAVPETDYLIGFALSGASRISGKTTQEAIAYMQSAFSTGSSQ
jgi:hypothetical protein